MRANDIIIKKRDGDRLSEDEITFFIHGYSKDEIPDYQASALLMAVFLNGMDEEETFCLTKAMLTSGKVLDLGAVRRPKVDKHSTGGVGDKISLILAPAAAACGLAVPMTSGRGLGFTGGTLDKLESIPGFRVALSGDELISILGDVGFAMTGQTPQIAPADKKLYSLRDVTGTVESIPLITSSIMSKKLAEGVDGIVLDVKFGSGAFMKSRGDARALAESIVSVARRMGKQAAAILTSMDQPLGRAVGNSLEVIESIECLHGAGEPDLLELTAVLGSHMLLLGGIVQALPDGERLIRGKILNGEAFERFRASVKAQGGDVRAVDDPSRLPSASRKVDVAARGGGYISGIDTEAIGTAAVYLGAGRFTKEENVDPSCGMVIRRKYGEYVREGEPVATLHYNSSKNLDVAVDLVGGAFIFTDEEPPPFRLVHDVIK
jgi:pyrimidine-nucleoside phosphorylase